MLTMFSGRDLLRIGRRADRAARERAEEGRAPGADDRARAVEQENRRLRGLLRRRRSA